MVLHAPLLLFALFGGDDNDDPLAEVAEVLETEASKPAVRRELETVVERLDEAYSYSERNLDPSQKVPSDASPTRKAEAVRTAVRTEFGGRQDDAGTAVVRAAVNLRDEIQPRSPTGKRLLDQLAGVRTDGIEDTLRSTVDALDDHERARRELDAVDDVDSVADLAEAYRDRSRRRREAAAEQDQLTQSVERLLDELDVERDDEDLTRAVKRATRELRRSDDGDRTEGLVEAVGEARREHTPRSRRARDLYEAIESGATDDTVDALVDAAERLDRAATTDSLTGGVDPDEVAAAAADVEADLASYDGEVADAVATRVAELSDRLERTDGSNRVVPFAAREEIQFYRDHLVDRLGPDPSSTSAEGGDPETLRDRVTELRARRDRVQSDYVEERSDHNHSIPLYFLSLVDTALEDADECIEAGDFRRADGTLSTTAQLLDHVEGLYERNQYSVMLRSLRG